jgi:hypothetical protein
MKLILNGFCLAYSIELIKKEMTEKPSLSCFVESI